MKVTQFTTGRIANKLVVEIAAASKGEEAVTREFQWGKDVSRATAERESLLICESEQGQ